MGLRHYLNILKQLDDVAIELAWRTGPEHVQTCEPPLARGTTSTSQLIIHWPTEYQWPPTERWMGHILAAFGRLVPVNRTTIPQERYPEGVVVAHFEYRGATYPVTIDFSDYMDRICEPALADSIVYFKMQFRRGGYGHTKILPGGYPVGAPYAYRFLSKLRRSADERPKLFDVYGRFGMRFAAEIRRKAIAHLSAAKDLNFVGGTKFVRNSRFLRDMARTKIGIDLPGNGDFCFRLVDYLSIGVCVIGPRHRTEFPAPLVDGEHIVYCRDDLSDLVPLCRRYLADERERTRIARKARRYFDHHLHRDQLAHYYLGAFFDAVDSGTDSGSHLGDCNLSAPGPRRVVQHAEAAPEERAIH